MRFLPEGKKIQGRTGETLLDAARRAGVDFVSPCAGLALCAGCVLKVVDGVRALSEPTAEEDSVLGKSGILEGSRLGCRSRLVGDEEITIFIPSQSRLGTSVLLSDGMKGNERLNPAITKVRMSLPQDSEPSASYVGPALEDGWASFTQQARTNLGRIVAEGKAKDVFLVTRGKEVLDARDDCRLLGMAVDVGTTKVAGYLVDLESGETLSVVTDINPQIVYGEDVISRLACALRGERDRLQARIAECIGSLVGSACKAAGVLPSDIYEFLVVGNTAMHHLLLNLDPKPIAYAPYSPVSTEAIDIQANSVNVEGNREARLYLPPLIGGYVGSDVVADMMATGMYEDSRTSILVDIGTNTEIVVKKSGSYFACSTASGPAFEGAHITFGMRAATGAIDRIEVSVDAEPRFTVIGGTKPRGLTGSAVVDAVAELFRIGIIDRSGALVRRHTSWRLRTGGSGYREYVIARGDETDNGVDLTINQRDIREIQLAKAAIRAGTNILMKHAGLSANEVEVMHVAGAFGLFISPVSARKLGLYPEVELDRVRTVGNTAVTGARALLISRDARKASEKMSKEVRHVELADDASFRQEFINSISIPYAVVRTA